MAEQAVLGIGSNLGDREDYLRRAVELLCQKESINLVAASSIYETPPLDIPSSQGDFINQVVVISTSLSPTGLLSICQEIEVILGRPGDHTAGASRTIDIDLISYGSLIHNSGQLVLPHPKYARRKFVLVPLAEVLPDFRDPLTGRSIRQLLENCPDISVLHRWDRLQEAPC
ncbi:MAG: 2-amino-4-hydroxy-6-hydroxymethyldihydropteridine diphosphokinase [Fidelibacterota bacterium]|nr:MAG: 2-amino-4-hydroxy-6-hydroxymethyldihydropteridine diphosphokinase [Candidatus Neomarinimicrobiota bacterium]